MSAQPYLAGLENEYRDPGKSQFYTPPKTALRIAEFALRGWKSSRALQVLEPSCGRGALIAALLELNPKSYVLGIDIDLENVVACRGKWADDSRTAFECHDFVSWHGARRFDLSIQNTPFEDGQTEQHILHALKLADRVVAHCPLTTLAGKDRGEVLWSKFDMPRMAICSTRPKYGNGGGMTEMATFELVERPSYTTQSCKTQIEFWP